MAKHSAFAASAPPTAPERETTARLLLRAWVIVVLAMGLGYSGVYNLVGTTGTLIVLTVVTAVSLAIWVPAIVQSQPVPLGWRRFPWVALGYLAFALISVLWSAWPSATLVTWALLASMTLHAIFIAHMLTWRELFRALASALKWLLALSVGIELWVAVVLRHPIFPNFFTPPSEEIDPHWYWVEGQLFTGERIQGIVGNANLLAPLCLMAIIVFGVLFFARVRWRATLALWMLLALYLLIRAGSATIYIAAAVCAFTLVIALIMRQRTGRGERTAVYAVALGTAAVIITLGVIFRHEVLDLMDRSSNLTGRRELWEETLALAHEHLWFGWGFSSPWVPVAPEMAEWLDEVRILTFHAHSMWIDPLFQLGIIGVALMGLAYFMATWRTWFFAVDRPRWDLRADRPFSPLTLAPSLIVIMLLVQGLTESAPIMMWGWMLVVLFSYKIKVVPLIGVGLSERTHVTEHGKAPRRVP